MLEGLCQSSDPDIRLTQDLLDESEESDTNISVSIRPPSFGTTRELGHTNIAGRLSKDVTEEVFAGLTVPVSWESSWTGPRSYWVLADNCLGWRDT